MNRAERRRQEREKSKQDATIRLKVGDVEAIKKDAVHQATLQAFELMVGLPCLVLHDKWGFGKQRLERFVWQCMDLLNAFNDGYLTVEDIHQALKDDCGVVIGKGAGK